LMKLSPRRMPTLLYGVMKRLGRWNEAEIPQLGEPIDALATEFELPPLIDRQLLTPAQMDQVKV
jgi:hypothetical protein